MKSISKMTGFGFFGALLAVLMIVAAPILIPAALMTWAVILFINAMANPNRSF